MKEPKPTRKSLLEEMSALVEKEMVAVKDNDRMRKKILLEKRALIAQMLDELPHYIWPEPPRLYYPSHRYYQVLLVTVGGWSCDRTYTETPHGYIKNVNLHIENSYPNEYSEYGSDLNTLLEVEHLLGIQWFYSGKYDVERHQRYDLGFSTVLRLTVDSTICQIVDIQWADPWKQVQWRDVVIPSEVLKKYHNLVEWRDQRETPDLTALGVPKNTLLFTRKVRFQDRKMMEIRLESSEDDVWLCGRMLDRSGSELTFDYFRRFPGVFALQVGDTRYEAILKERKEIC